MLEHLHSLYERIGENYTASNPNGRCPVCNGTGTVIGDIDPGCMIAPELSLKHGAVLLWSGTVCRPVSKIKALANMIGIDFDRPLSEQDDRFPDILLYGYDKEPVSYVHKGKPFEGFYRGCVFDLQDMRDAETTSKGNLRAIAFFSRRVKCFRCSGNGPNLERFAATVNGRSLLEAWRLPVSELLLFVCHLPASPDNDTDEIVAEIEACLIYLNKIGLKTLPSIEDKFRFPANAG
ncbi:hypothetical protein DL346_20745 [Paenibacillus montanisoli]|uniref:UvrA DNA-binding domain-containing protein n=1 Tax=Paenibacillus montanisoli TaxID=2081970 RepID=A0A328TVG4_9BACL|nr:hypothetical protein DL346_20745 [Paenibacillus montanisoli]